MAGPEGNSFELVARGDRTQRPALMENELRRMLRDRRTSVPGASIGALLTGDTSQTVVRVENTVYNTNYSRGEVIGLSDLSITPTDNPAAWDQPVTMTGVEAEENSAYGIWLEPANYGELGRAVIYGLAVTQVNMRNANDTWADVAANQTHLASKGFIGSAEILWSESWGTSNTGLKKAIVRLGNRNVFQLATISAVSNGTYEDNSGQWTYTGDIVGGTAGITLRNTCEVATSDIGPNSLYGNGVWIVKTTGRLVNSDCFIVPLGIGITVQCWPDPDNEGDYLFSMPNSAEVPQP